MKQALHIFRKDIRRLWLPVLISLAGIVAFVWVESQPVSGRVLTDGGFLKMFIVAGWLHLTARLFHEEALPGDTHFWLSRPYSRLSLGMSKLCFAIMFIALPFLIGSIVILMSWGFEIMPGVPGLLVKLFFLAALFWLPALALATVSQRLPGYLLGLFLAFGGFFALGQPFMSGVRYSPLPLNFRWISQGLAEVILFLGATAIFVWQYQTRRTGIGWVVLAAVVLLAVALVFYLPLDVAKVVSAAVESEPRPLRQVVLAVGADGVLDPPSISGNSTLRNARVLSFPCRLTGVPENTEVSPDGAIVHIGDGDSVFAMVNTHAYRGLTLYVHPDQFDRVAHRPVRIAGTIWVTLLRPQQPYRAPFGRPVALPVVGRCDSAQDRSGAWVWCTVPFKSSHRIEVTLVARDTGERTDHQRIAYPYPHSPLPADFGFSPVHRAYSYHPVWLGRSRVYGGAPSPARKQIDDYDVEYAVATPVAHLSRDFVIENVVLSKLPDGV